MFSKIFYNSIVKIGKIGSGSYNKLLESELVKKVDFTYQLNRLQNNISLQLENTFSKYLTRTEVEKKFTDIGKAFVQIVTPQEFRVLKSKNLVKENNLYLVSKYGKPQEFYIGKILIAKRNEEVAQGFAYTFPITF